MRIKIAIIHEIALNYNKLNPIYIRFIEHPIFPNKITIRPILPAQTMQRPVNNKPNLIPPHLNIPIIIILHSIYIIIPCRLLYKNSIPY